MVHHCNSPSVDVYAIGCVLYELCLGPSKPATALLLVENKDDLLQDITKLYGKQLYVLIHDMVQTKQDLRPTFADVLTALQTMDVNIQ